MTQAMTDRIEQLERELAEAKESWGWYKQQVEDAHRGLHGAAPDKVGGIPSSVAERIAVLRAEVDRLGAELNKQRSDDTALRVFAKSVREHDKLLVLRTAWAYLQRIAKRHRYGDGFVEWWVVEGEVESLLNEADKGTNHG